MKSECGKLTIQSEKVAYGYQLVAYKKFGREKLLKVPSNKLSNSLTISHLCGSRNCVISDHLIL
jgi:hypothetical protein